MYYFQSIPFLTCLLLSALVVPAAGQTYTSCNPLNKTCPADIALGTTFNQTFSTGSSFDSTYWTVEEGQNTFAADGTDFTIYQHGDAPTIQSTYSIFFGRVEVIMKAAAGQGIISSIVLLSDDLDEIDWEIMGGNTTHVETNYYGKGGQNQINSQYFPCDGPQTSFHNYTTVWTSDQLEWHLDGNIVRTLAFADAVKGGKSIYPQTPSHLKLGSWAGGDSNNAPGTIAWAGGPVDYNQGPFTMTVQSVVVTDGHTNASSYVYENHSGSWQSIQVVEGLSNVNQKIHAPPPLTLAQRWTGLSMGVRIAIISVSSAVGAAMLGLLACCCIVQRKQGRRERALADAQWDREQNELAVDKQRWARGEYLKKAPMVDANETRSYWED